jgi:hypothetical protein
MKKQKLTKRLIAIIIVLNTTISFAQNTSFGFTAGYSFLTQKTTTGTVDSGGTDTASGFGVGAFMDYYINDTFSILPQVFYTSVKNQDNNNSVSFLQIPILAKYNISDNFSIMAGPQVNYSLSDQGANVKKTSFAFDAGLMYSFSEDYFIQANYALGISDTIDLDDFEAKMHFLNISLGYKFN